MANDDFIMFTLNLTSDQIQSLQPYPVCRRNGYPRNRK